LRAVCLVRAMVVGVMNYCCMVKGNRERIVERRVCERFSSVQNGIGTS